jgi:hypothetical protein
LVGLAPPSSVAVKLSVTGGAGTEREPKKERANRVKFAEFPPYSC